MTKTMQELVYLAGCLSPDTAEGRAYLYAIYWAHADELVNYGDDRDTGLHELVDAALPVATHEQWMIFADLGGWLVDVDEIMGKEGDVSERMRVAVCMIGDTLMQALEAEHLEQKEKVTT